MVVAEILRIVTGREDCAGRLCSLHKGFQGTLADELAHIVS
jgi:hypothetical protein